jgi:hypothetical protein
MSYMTTLERHARRAVAISMLNDLRRHAEQQQPLRWDDADRSIFRDAIEFSQAKEPSFKVFRYSFQGMGKDNEAAALQLYTAVTDALSELAGNDETKRSAYLDALNALASAQGVAHSKRDDVIRLIEAAMDRISCETQEELRERSNGMGL